MEEKLLKIFKLADSLNEKQNKVFAEIEYTADDRKTLQITIREKNTFKYVERYEIKLADKLFEEKKDE